MNDTVQRLGKATGIDVPEALALVSESVWWITLVDATVVRYHEAAYDHALISLSKVARADTDGTFSGLRFVRNWMGYHADPADFIEPQYNADGGEAPLAAWTWSPLPAPELGTVAPRGRKWELARYRDYRTFLTRKPLGDTVGAAAGFLNGISAGP